MLNIRNWLIFYIIITNFNIALASTWQKIDEYEVASNKLVIKFNDAPIIGVDKPFTTNILKVKTYHSDFSIPLDIDYHIPNHTYCSSYMDLCLYDLAERFDTH